MFVREALTVPMTMLNGHSIVQLMVYLVKVCILHPRMSYCKCMPILLYGLDARPVNKTDLRSLDFTVDRVFYEAVQYRKHRNCSGMSGLL